MYFQENLFSLDTNHTNVTKDAVKVCFTLSLSCWVLLKQLALIAVLLQFKSLNRCAVFIVQWGLHSM